MNCVHVPKEKLDWIAKESNHVFVLTVEMEKVLDWYRDHPHFRWILIRCEQRSWKRTRGSRESPQ